MPIPTTKDMFLAAHPVGSYYWSSEATSPATLFGGSWTQIKDRFVLAAGDTYKVGGTGGVATHTHGAGTYGATVDMPGSYNILIRLVSKPTETNWQPNRYYPCGHQAIAPGNGCGSVAEVLGSSGESSNMPPYIVAYCWRRTA